MNMQCDKDYLLNNTVIFIPGKNLLISRRDKSQHVLFSTASRCLALLIKNQGNIVNHRQLYECGWEAQGKEVTPNTLYQTISELRRQLKKAGLDSKVIKTQPRHGWFIGSTELQVEEYELEESPVRNVTDEIVYTEKKMGLSGRLSFIQKLKYVAISLALIL